MFCLFVVFVVVVVGGFFLYFFVAEIIIHKRYENRFFQKEKNCIILI